MKRHAEVVVVGAGVVGLSVAYHLAVRGRRVLLLDACAPGCGASGGNLGQISVMDREPAIQLAWTNETLSLYRRLEEEEGLDFEANYSGGLLLFCSAEQKEQGLALMERQRGRGVPIEPVEGSALKGIEPHLDADRLLGALYSSREGSIMPLKVVSGLTEASRRHGVGICAPCRVTGFRVGSGRVKSVVTKKEEIETDCVVLAAGAWSREVAAFLGMELPVYYHKGTALVTRPVPPLVRTVVVSGGFLTNRPLTNRIVGLGVAQHPNGSLIIGQATEPGRDYKRDLSVEGVYETIRNFLRYFPDLGSLEIIRSWAANTTFTPDGLPVFGFSPEFDNLFVASGLKGAFSTAPAAGNMAAAMICRGGGSMPSPAEWSDILQEWKLDPCDLDSIRPNRRLVPHG